MHFISFSEYLFDITETESSTSDCFNIEIDVNTGEIITHNSGFVTGPRITVTYDGIDPPDVMQAISLGTAASVVALAQGAVALAGWIGDIGGDTGMETHDAGITSDNCDNEDCEWWSMGEPTGAEGLSL